MKRKKAVIIGAVALLLILITAIILTIGSAHITTIKGRTLSQFSLYVNGIELFHGEYGYYPEFKSSKELADILEEENKKKICFVSFTDSDQNQAGEIIDFYGNEIFIAISGENLVCISAGEDGIFDSVDYIDDIILQHKLRSQPVGAGQPDNSPVKL